MERLTKPDEIIDGGVKRAKIDVNEERKRAMSLYWKLKEYEDTKLTPEEILDLAKELDVNSWSSIENLSTDDLITMCEEIFDWNKSGTLSSKSSFYKFAKVNIENTIDLKHRVLEEAYRRFGTTCLLLFGNFPEKFLRR